MSYEFDFKKEYAIQELSTKFALESYLKKYAGSLTRYQWYLITKNKNFKLEMVDSEYFGLLDWEFISMSIPLSINEMENYSGYLNWYCISAFQKLTIPFIEKYIDYLSLDVLLRNNSLDKETLEYANKIYHANNDEKHYIIWRDNLLNARTFRPYIKASSQIKILKTEHPSDADIKQMQKAELKKYLDTYHIRYLYKNTLPELREMLQAKCHEMDANSTQPKNNAENEYASMLLCRIRKENQSADIKFKIDYGELSKNELKRILDKRNIKYLYKDTLEILRLKCERSE